MAGVYMCNDIGRGRGILARGVLARELLKI